jgi:SAM-dependent methyltransferase
MLERLPRTLARLAARRPTAASATGCLRYRCNICDRICETKVLQLTREEPSCPRCGSTVRARAIVRVLSLELFGTSLPLSKFPIQKDLRGIGLSDWDAHAVRLARAFDYRNTHFDSEPRLDITADIDPALEGTLDFLIASEVFEHVAPPVSEAFRNSYKLLRPRGVLIFSVPYRTEGATEEHYPDLFRYEIERTADKTVLKNTTRDGRKQAFSNLVFHGGEGATVEMRIFAEASLLDEFARAGFQNVMTYNDPDFEHGIYWNEDWSGGSFPMSARKQPL